MGNIVVINYASVLQNLSNFFTEKLFTALGYIIAHGIGHNATIGGHDSTGIMTAGTEVREMIKSIYGHFLDEPIKPEYPEYPKLKSYIQKATYQRKNNLGGYQTERVRGLYLLALPPLNDETLAKKYGEKHVKFRAISLNYILSIKKHYGKNKNFFERAYDELNEKLED